MESNSTLLTTLLLTPTPLRDPLLRNFALLPSATLAQSKLWNVVTAPYFESHPARSILNFALFILLSRYHFSPWSNPQLLAYVTIVNVLAACVTCVVMLAAYVATRAGTFIFTPIATTSGVCASLLIVFKQIHPDVTLGLRNLNIPSTYFPLCYFTIMVLLTLLKLTPIGVLFFTGCALQVAWTYLRFFRRAQDGAYGDHSDSFAYSALFPQVMKPIISPIASLTHLVWSPVLSKWQPAELQSSLPSLQEPSKASDRDAERRRQRALLALEEKLKADAAKEADNSV